jgi:hypothetical protein
VPKESSLTAAELADEYFIENRNRLLEIAAFLDRLDRADPARANRDFRMRALSDALQVVAGEAPGYVTQIQMLLSDPTTELLPALDRKSARGAWEDPR